MVRLTINGFIFLNSVLVNKSKKQSKNLHKLRPTSRVDDLYKWNQNKEKKIKKLQKEASKHQFKPVINPVSKIIAEKERAEASITKSESSEPSLSTKNLNISVHEKLYLSRNNSHGLLPTNNKSCINRSQKFLEARSNSVADLKTFQSPMPRIREEKERSKRLPPSGPKSKR